MDPIPTLRMVGVSAQQNPGSSQVTQFWCDPLCPVSCCLELLLKWSWMDHVLPVTGRHCSLQLDWEANAPSASLIPGVDSQFACSAWASAAYRLPVGIFKHENHLTPIPFPLSCLTLANSEALRWPRPEVHVLAGPFRASLHINTLPM